MYKPENEPFPAGSSTMALGYRITDRTRDIKCLTRSMRYKVYRWIY